MDINKILKVSDKAKETLLRTPFSNSVDEMAFNFKENKKKYIMDLGNYSLYKDNEYHEYDLENYLESLKQTFHRSRASRNINPRQRIEFTLGCKQSIISGILCSSWLMSKQVFEPSQELCNSIATMVPDKTEDARKFVLYKSIIDRLPYDTFILDLSNVSLPFETSDLYKVYIASFITTDNNDLLLSVLPVEECMKENFVGNLLYFGDEDKSMEIIINDLIGSYEDGRDAKYVNFIFNLITYLSVINSDIRPSMETRYSYRPSRKIKNVYSEIQKWEVGWTYAEAIKLHEEQMNKRRLNGKRVILEDGDDEDLIYKRKPHVRRAHWCRYHCGPGRRDLEVKWIDTIWVNGKYQSEFIVTDRNQGDQTKELKKRGTKYGNGKK